MDRKIFSIVVFGVVFVMAMHASSAHAELKINPYPMGEKPAVEGSELVYSVQQAAKSKQLVFEVPQPGDPYFDPPSQETLAPVVAETVVEPKAVPVAENNDLEPIDALEMMESAEIEPAAAPVLSEPEEELVLRMSDSYDDMVVAEPPRKEVPQEKPSEAVLQSAPEKVVWYSERAPRKTPVPDADHVVASMTRWEAQEGADIQRLLERWAADSQVELIWDNPSDYEVLEGFEIDGTFENAVQALLDQYKDNRDRPMATLHIDPETRAKTLIIRSLS